MKRMMPFLALSAGLCLSACQTTTGAVEAETPKEAAEIVGVCHDPQDRRDKYLAAQIAKGNSPEVIAEVRDVYIARGSSPEESSSFLTFLEILTGAPSPRGPQEAANYTACIARFQ